MLINNYFFLAMDMQQELDRTLQRQDFGRDTLLSDSLAAYIQAARMYAQIEIAIAVLSDLQANRSYIYYGGVGDVLGVSPSGTSHETDSIWEKEIFDRIQPDDLVRKHAQELRFFHFVKKQPLGMGGIIWRCMCGCIRLSEVMCRFVTGCITSSVHRRVMWFLPCACILCVLLCCLTCWLIRLPVAVPASIVSLAGTCCRNVRERFCC